MCHADSVAEVHVGRGLCASMYWRVITSSLISLSSSPIPNIKAHHRSVKTEAKRKSNLCASQNTEEM